MNRPAILVTAIVVFAIGIGNVVLGSNLIMPLEQAWERGAGVPWYLVWGMILITLLCAIMLGGFLMSAGLGRSARR